MKKFCKHLKEHAKGIINFRKEKYKFMNKRKSRNHIKMQNSVTLAKKSLK